MPGGPPQGLPGNPEFYEAVHGAGPANPDELYTSWEHFYLAKVVREVPIDYLGFEKGVQVKKIRSLLALGFLFR